MNKVYRTEGRYYLGSSDEAAQYVFQFRNDAPKGLQRGFIVDLEKDRYFNGSALEVAREIMDVYESYWINTTKPHLKAVIEYLEKWEEKDKFDGLIEEKEKLQVRLKKIENELSEYDHEEMREWVPLEEGAS